VQQRVEEEIQPVLINNTKTLIELEQKIPGKCVCLMHTHIHARARTHTQSQTHTHTHTHACVCVFVCVCVCIGLKGRLFKKEVKDDAEYLVFPLLGGMVVQKQKLNVAQV